MAKRSMTTARERARERVVKAAIALAAFSGTHSARGCKCPACDAVIENKRACAALEKEEKRE